MNRQRLIHFAVFLLSSLVILGAGQTGFAAEPMPWQLGLQPAATPVAEELYRFHNMLLIIIAAIVLFVFGLLVYVVLRFNAKANPVPSKTTHNVKLEVIWTVIPVLILVVIAVPSYRLLYFMDRVENPDMTLKVTGYQWYWGYNYVDEGEDLSFLSYMIPNEDIDPSQGHRRLLSVDQPVVLPIDTNIQILVTAGDVLHSFAMPAFGIKTDAVPGRINETWVRIEKPGIYYGQCSELCGTGHAFMPSEIHAVPMDDYKQWVEAKKAELNGGEKAVSPLAKQMQVGNLNSIEENNL